MSDLKIGQIVDLGALSADEKARELGRMVALANQSEELTHLRIQLDHAQARIAELEAREAEAAAVIARGVELMTLEQLSQWDGVRAWQEMES